jgi:fructokinase
MKESYSAPAICYGEVLWDVLQDGPQPGGAPLNVAYHLNKFGVDTSVVSRIGQDDNGRKLKTLMDDWGINTDLLQQDGFYQTSEVIAKMDDRNEVSYEIVFPVAWDFISNESSIKNYIKPETYFVYGSLASRNDTSRDTLYSLLESPAIKVFDINLRPPFIKKDLLEVLLQKADIVKFNQSELHLAQELFGGFYLNEAQQVKFIQKRFEVSELIVTKGEFGASYYKNDDVFHVPSAAITVADTIGSGDAFLAAFIAGRYFNETPETILKNAIAMGAFIATKKGGCPAYQLSDYKNFRNTI